jgi:hypothetical protein
MSVVTIGDGDPKIRRDTIGEDGEDDACCGARLGVDLLEVNTSSRVVS